jgi:riboflavin kinase/FMN adenylyltransferase
LQQVVAHAKKVDGESVLLTFEPHPRKLLFPDQPLKLLTPLHQKLELISRSGIDHIIVVPFTHEFADLSAEAYIEDFLVKKIGPNSIIIGYDHRFGHDRKGNIELLKAHAGACDYKVYEIPAQLIDAAAVSSTKIRHALQESHVEEATHMLGRPYSITGKVVRGAQLGRSIGYPTANIIPLDAEQLIPANGVYAVRAKWEQRFYNGMLNIGVRPTVSNELTLHIEAHLFDFDGDLYDKELEIFFIDRIRNEEKFPSLDALKEQLAKDKITAMSMLNS